MRVYFLRACTRKSTQTLTASSFSAHPQTPLVLQLLQPQLLPNACQLVKGGAPTCSSSSSNCSSKEEEGTRAANLLQITMKAASVPRLCLLEQQVDYLVRCAKSVQGVQCAQSNLCNMPSSIALPGTRTDTLLTDQVLSSYTHKHMQTHTHAPHMHTCVALHPSWSTSRWHCRLRGNHFCTEEGSADCKRRSPSPSPRPC